MSKHKFCVVISTYNAFNHLRVSYDIIRYNWRKFNETPICLSCNNPDEVRQEINDLKIDKLAIADHTIPWTLDGGKTTYRAGFRARALDCFQNGCKAALDLGTDYTLHTHADGWVLSIEKVLDIIHYMQKNNKVLAAGGWGLDYKIERHDIKQTGDLDDYFFIIDNNFARKSGFWNFKAVAGDPVIGHAWYLVTRFLELAKPEELYLYQDYKSGEIESGSANPRDVAPWRYDTKHRMLHIDDFNTYNGKISEIFQRNNISQGKYVRQLLKGELLWKPSPPRVNPQNFLSKIKNRVKNILCGTCEVPHK